MTPEGEELTLKGEITDHIFSVNREVTLHHSNNADSFSSLVDQITNRDGDNLQMIFVTKGRLGCKLRNAKKPSFIFEDQQHNLLSINKRMLWQIVEEGEHEILCLNISFSFLSRYLPHDHSGYLDLKKGMELSKPAAFSINNLYITPEINAILNTLKSSPHTGFCAKLFLESKVLELLMLQASQFEQSKISETTHLKKEEMSRMQEVKEILTENMDTPFSLRTLAHMVGTNEFNLKRNFKIAFGTTVYGYLNQYKMEQAKIMLIEKDITIAELSVKMGYKYATHFTSAFKKYFGYLPNKLKSGKLSIMLFIGDIITSSSVIYPYQ